MRDNRYNIGKRYLPEGFKPLLRTLHVRKFKSDEGVEEG